MIGAVKKVEKSFTPKRKVWKLKNATRVDLKMSFRDQFMQLVKLPMLKTFGNRLRRTYRHLQLLWLNKGPPRHRVTWWWNDNVDIALKEKRRF